MRGSIPTTILFLILVAAGASVLRGVPPDENARVPVRIDEEQSAGIHNLYRLSPRVLSGSQPEGEAGFESLRRLGVRTIISVDGGRTDPETARRHGMRYVHLPIGYDGIEEPRILELVAAAKSLPGPVYVHCHHGKHRGPTAAAVICLSLDGWNHEQALSWMEDAGTSPKYAGLYRTVREFEVPAAAALEAVPAEFPEQAEVSSMVEAMVAIDATWQHLIAVRDAEWGVPADNPDLVPTAEARVLWEHFRELRRLDEAKSQGEEFLRTLREAEEAGKRLEAALDGDAVDAERAATAFKSIEQSCARCHATFRN